MGGQFKELLALPRHSFITDQLYFKINGGSPISMFILLFERVQHWHVVFIVQIVDVVLVLRVNQIYLGHCRNIRWEMDSVVQHLVLVNVDLKTIENQ